MNIYAPGSLIANRYEVVSKPLVGGMGIVYLCMDNQEDRPVAIKTIQPKYMPNRTVRDRFLREGTAWIDLGTHPHIVRCYAVDYIDPIAFLCLEFVAKEQGRDGASLRSWIGSPMPIDQALLFTLQIALGMKHAAEKITGFVHRDLKPENILVGAYKLPDTEINCVKVTDFGLALIQKDDSEEHKEDQDSQTFKHTHLTHGIIGTPLYMAPEQWKGEAVGVYTDIYALGCILYELLTGKPAAQGSTIIDLQTIHCEGRLATLPEDLPDPITSLLTRSFELCGKNRYTTWNEIVCVLDSALQICCKKSLPIGNDTELADGKVKIQMGWSFRAIGHAYLDIGKAYIAKAYFEKGVQIGRSCNDDGLIAANLGNLGLAFGALGELQQAAACHNSALEIARNIHARRVESNCLVNLGLSLIDLGDFHNALGYLEQALCIDREIGNVEMEGNILGNIGIAYYHLGQVQKAISYYRQALEKDLSLGNKRDIGADMGNLGLALIDVGDYSHAVDYLVQHLDIAKNIGDRNGEGNALCNLGIAFKKKGDLTRAVSFYSQALDVAQELKDIGLTAMANYNLALLYVQLGNLEQAISCLQRASHSWRQIGYIDAYQDAQQLETMLQNRNKRKK